MGCNSEAILLRKAIVQHESGRITKQTWKLCGLCNKPITIDEIRKKNNKISIHKWFTEYRKTKKRAYVLEFSEPFPILEMI